MKNYDVFVAALMQKTVLDAEKGIFIYRTIGIMDDGEMDFKTGMFIDHKTDKIYSAMESEEAIFSETDYFYGFPISKQDLKNNYPDMGKKDRLKEYYEDLNRYVYFGVFDEKISGMKIIEVWKEALKKMQMEADMKEFAVMFEEGMETDLVMLPLRNVDQILKLLEKKDGKEIKNYFKFLKKNATNELQDLKKSSEEAQSLLRPKEKENIEAEKEGSSISVPTLEKNNFQNTSSINVYSAYEQIKKKVIGQDETIKKVLSVIHTNDLMKDSSYKSRCLIVGKTGCGKTEILRNIGKITNRPFVRTDSTQITIAGYVGGSIEGNIIAPLLTQTKGDLNLAQSGIVALDEIDKKGSGDNADVAGRGVLNSFLPFLDGTQYPITLNGKKIMFDTSNLIVFASGAFSNVFDYSSKKMRRIGIKGSHEVEKKEIDIDDFIKIGLMPDEFMGRFPILAFMNELSLTDFENILINSETSPLHFYEKLFLDNYHISLKYDSNCIQLLAKKAHEHKLGARALQKIVEEILEECRWEIYARNIQNKELILTEKTVENPKEYILK